MAQAESTLQTLQQTLIDYVRLQLGDQIKAVTGGGKPAARKAFGEIKVTETKYNGRGNNNLIILWAW